MRRDDCLQYALDYADEEGGKDWRIMVTIGDFQWSGTVVAANFTTLILKTGGDDGDTHYIRRQAIDSVQVILGD